MMSNQPSHATGYRAWRATLGKTLNESPTGKINLVCACLLVSSDFHDPRDIPSQRYNCNRIRICFSSRSGFRTRFKVKSASAVPFLLGILRFNTCTAQCHKHLWIKFRHPNQAWQNPFGCDCAFTAWQDPVDLDCIHNHLAVLVLESLGNSERGQSLTSGATQRRYRAVGAPQR